MDCLKQSSEDVNVSPFTRNIRYVRNPSDLKLPTLKTYDENIDRTVHLMRYIRHIEMLSAFEEFM